MSNLKTSRRNFIKKSAFAVSLPMIVPSSVLGLNGQTAPSNRISVGGIGLGPRGRKVLGPFLEASDCQFVAIADPQSERRNIIKRLTDRKYGNTDCTTYADMSEVLERDDIDAVIIATGDRWHTTASIYAARAGKDIYCEKPCAMNMQECAELDDAIQENDRVFQAGTQRRSVPQFSLAAELAQSGQLGELKSVHAGILKLRNYNPPLPAEPEPGLEVVNWDAWLGPAPDMPYNNKYCKGRWRDQEGLYAAWRLPEWGTHTIDLCQWAADADGTCPVEYESVNDGLIYAKYADGKTLVMRLAGFKGEGDWSKGLGPCPIRFEGDEGWIEAGDYKALVTDRPELLEGKDYKQIGGGDPVYHVRNFLDCVKTREKPLCNSTVMRNGHLASFAAATSWKLGRKLTFDPVTETFVNDDEANSYRTYERRAPYTI